MLEEPVSYTQTYSCLEVYRSYKENDLIQGSKIEFLGVMESITATFL